MASLIKAFQHSRTFYNGYSSYIISTFQNLLPQFHQLRHFNILELVTTFTLVKTFSTNHVNILELVTTFTLVKTFQHSRSGYHGYSSLNISIFQNWLPRLLYLHHFNILELVTMVSLIKAFQHSRTGYHGYSSYIISTFQNCLPWFL